MTKDLDKKLNTQPYKGARDFYPKDMQVRNYIFDVLKGVAKKMGFSEYDAPILERWEIYAAKTGEEIVNKQLFWFEDHGGRKLAIRPEKTPSLARLVALKVNELPKPIKWFNIGNCWRYEKPQKGRGREFYQFDCDILGSESIQADVEVFSIPVEIMKEFGADETMFEIRVNSRRFVEYYLRDIVDLEGGMDSVSTPIYEVIKALDLKNKTTKQEFLDILKKINLNETQIKQIMDFCDSDLKFVKQYEEKSYGAKEIIQFFELIKLKGYEKYFKYDPGVVRGLDYYTGIVIEQYDLKPENNRSMFGGGRYDNLVELFSDKKMPATGFAMGDITLKNFLEGWNLLPKFDSDIDYLVTLWPKDTDDNKYLQATFETAEALRNLGKNVTTWLDPNTKLDKQLKYADKLNIPYVIIIGETELTENTLTIKDLAKNSQQTVPFEKFLNEID